MSHRGAISASEPDEDAAGAAAVAAAVGGGCNVVGYFRAELGIGEAARLLLSGMDEAGIPYNAIVFGEGTASRQEHPFEEAVGAPSLFGTNVVCLNPPEFRLFANAAGPEFFGRRYTVGFWWWEVADFPASFRRAFGLVDEVWVGNDFIASAIGAETDKPVVTVPLPIVAPVVDARSRAELGLPGGYLFLFLFDFFSVFERKNPLGVVDAFTRAFRPGDGPVLVVKSINGEHHPDQLQRLRAAAAGRPDVHVIDRYVSSSDRAALMASCDCYVSLHRSEGFGLTMAEAMALGRPVIATGYSGNLAFMNERNAYLVPGHVAPIPPGCDPYPAGTLWAEPDLDAAAAAMRKVHDRPDEAAEVGRRAREEVLSKHSPSATAAVLRERLAAIRARRRIASDWHVWDGLIAAKAAIEEAARTSPSARRLIGPPLDAVRGVLARGLAQERVSAAHVDALRELLLVQQDLARELGRLEARLAELERRDPSQL